MKPKTKKKKQIIQLIWELIDTTETRKYWTVNDIFDEVFKHSLLAQKLSTISQGMDTQKAKVSFGRFLANISKDENQPISVVKRSNPKGVIRWQLSRNCFYVPPAEPKKKDDKDTPIVTKNPSTWEYYLIRVLREIKRIYHGTSFTAGELATDLQDGEVREMYSFKNLNGRANRKVDKIPTRNELIGIFKYFEGIHPRIKDEPLGEDWRRLSFCVLPDPDNSTKWKITSKNPS